MDGAGHSSYWGSDLYYEMVKQKDMHVAEIFNALSTTKTSSGKPMIDETLVVMVADHGGYKNNHNWVPPFIAEVHVPLLLLGMFTELCGVIALSVLTAPARGLVTIILYL